MKLENQVPSLELCKRLKELGYPQEGLFYWQGYLHSNTRVELVSRDKVDFDYDYISAPTVAELGDKLQESSRAGISMAYNHVFNLVDSDKITLEGLVMCLMDVELVARMLIYLLENKIINLPSSK